MVIITLGDLLVLIALAFFLCVVGYMLRISVFGKRFNLTTKKCQYCSKRMWFWQELGYRNESHIPCIDKDYWSHCDSQEIRDFHTSHFGTRPWEKI